MQQRVQFVTDHYRGLYSMSELCVRYSISRKTGYKWLERFEVHGRDGLSDRSHAPHNCPHRSIEKKLAALLCKTRRVHRNSGPEKVRDYLRLRHPEIRDWSALSTIGDLLARKGVAANVVVGDRSCIRARCPLEPAQQTICGPPTSRATSVQVMGSTANHSRLRTSTRAFWSPAKACFRSRRSGARQVFEQAFRVRPAGGDSHG
jgi:hypothetical protein